FNDLSVSCGFALKLVEGSVLKQGDHVFANARSNQQASDTRQVRMEALAQIAVKTLSEGPPDVSAIVFYYINGLRVAPRGACNLRFRLDRGADGPWRWRAAGWETDEDDEWADLAKLDEG